MIKSFTNEKIKSVNAYLIINEKTNHAILIDTADLPKEINSYIKENNIILDEIIITHGHFDHIKGLDEIIKNNSNTNVWIHKKDGKHLYDSKKNRSSYSGKTWVMEYSPNIKNFIDDMSIKMIDYNINIKYLPGHTHGSVFIEVVDLKALFIGDTVFIDDNKSFYGRRKYFQAQTNPHGFKKAMKELNEKYSNRWKIYPGHYDFGFIIDDLRRINKDFKK